jgi:hypothetical protein
MVVHPESIYEIESFWLKVAIQVYEAFRFLVTDTLTKTNRNDTATIRVISFRKGYSNNNGASPNPKSTPTKAPTKPATILAVPDVLSNLRRPGSNPTTIPVMSMNIINIVPSVAYALDGDLLIPSSILRQEWALQIQAEW